MTKAETRKRRVTKRRTTKRPKARSTKRPRRRSTTRAKARPTKRAKVKSTKRAKPRTATRPKAGKPSRPRTTAAVRPARVARGAGRARGAAGLGAHVATELRRRGEAAPSPDLVRTIATVGAGYRRGPATDPPWPTALDLDERVAEGLVTLYWVGDRRPGPDRRIERRTAARWVDFNLEQYDLAVGPAVRDTLASLALGAWRPGLDMKTQVKLLVNLVVRWFRDGLG